MKVAAFQMDIAWGSPEDNVKKVINWIERDASDADLVVIPEMFLSGFNIKSSEVAIDIESDESMSQLHRFVCSSGKAIVGSVAVKEGENYYNRLFFYKPTGEKEYYDKRHLFRMAGEHKYYSGGDKRVVIEYMGFRILPLVCYDLRFPVWSRSQNDYDLMIYVASWPQVRSYQWSCLLKGRAIENRAYLIGVNRCGSDPKVSYSGDTVILDYLGYPISAAEPSKEEIICAELDLKSLNEFRESFPADKDADRFTIEL